MQYAISLLMASFLFVFPISETDERITSNWSVSDVKINHIIKGRDVYIECIIPDFSFQTENRQRGNVQVFLNDKKFKEVNQAAFILKDLPTGNQKITLKFVDDDGSYRYTKSFYVQIQ